MLYIDNTEKLNELCKVVKEKVSKEEIEECIIYIKNAMSEFPDAPHPHNLLGIILEIQGEHLQAMRHFRAANALDPCYLPASYNLQTYGTFYSSGMTAYDEEDIPKKYLKK